MWHWFQSDNSATSKNGNVFLIEPDSWSPSKELPRPQWRGFPPLPGQAVVVLWVQVFHRLPSSSQGLVCTRWHCNNTCYTTPFIYKITPPTPQPGQLSWSAAEWVFSFISSLWISLVCCKWMLLHTRICCYWVCMWLGVQNHSGHSHSSGACAQTGFHVALWIPVGLYNV